MWKLPTAIKNPPINNSTFIAIKKYVHNKKLSAGELLLLKIGKSEPILRTYFRKQCRRKTTEIP
jgi:hypothetical protein